MANYINLKVFLCLTFMLMLKVGQINCQAIFTQNLLFAQRDSFHTKLISPHSLHYVLGLAFLGSKGKTARQIQSNIEFSGGKSAVAYQMSESLRKAPEVKAANVFYLNRRLQLNQNVQENVNRIVGGNFKHIDYSDSPNSAKRFNNFVADQTQSSIKNLISKDDIDGDTTTIAINVDSFKADFEHPFKRVVATKQQAILFKTTEMMHQVNEFLYGKIPQINATAVVLPFRKSKNVLLLVLPNEKSDYERLWEQLRISDITDIPNFLKPKLVDLFLPRFNLSTSYVLQPTLENLKITEAFKPEANFNGFYRTGERSYLRSVVQKNFFKIGLNGVVASTATAAQWELTSHFVEPAKPQGDFKEPVESFIADHPFVYYIFNKATKTILLAGKHRWNFRNLLNNDQVELNQ